LWTTGSQASSFTNGIDGMRRLRYRSARLGGRPKVKYPR
jgi:hypothetical protein